MKDKKPKQYDEDGCVIRANKTEEKREREVIKAFIRDEMLLLANEQYAHLPINDKLVNALKEGKRLSGNAYQRHLSFLVRLIVEQNVEAIQVAVRKMSHQQPHNPNKIRQTEQYRDRLLEGDKTVIDELLSQFENIDIQYVRQLSRNANKEIHKQQQQAKQAVDAGAPPTTKKQPPSKSTKLLYQYLLKL